MTKPQDISPRRHRPSLKSVIKQKQNWDFGLGDKDISAAALVSRELHVVQRFLRNPHIDQEKYLISTGRHVDNVHRLGQQAMDGLPESPALADLRQRFHRGVEAHDWGEAIKEFYTFYDECHMQPGDIYTAERRIAEFAITLAYLELETEETGLLSRAIDEMRGQTEQAEGHHAADIITRYIEGFDFPQGALSADIKRRVLIWMHAYDEAEHDGIRKNSLIGNAVKALEKLEGDIYFYTHLGKGSGIGYDRASSFQVLKNVERTEPELAKVLSKAESETERAFAINIAHKTLTTIAEALRNAPRFIDREAHVDSEPRPTAPMQEIRNSKARLAQDFAAQFGEQQISRNSDVDMLLGQKIIPARLAARLYSHAAEALRVGLWTPTPGQVLIRSHSVPAGVKTYMAKQGHKTLEDQKNKTYPQP